jgi:hypothetical protein
MTTAQANHPQRRVALLLNWRSKGYARPHYGLVDDEELLRTGKSIFLSTDGRLLSATRDDLLLLQAAANAVVAAPIGDGLAGLHERNEKLFSACEL